jgi:segregation and condensation protein B
VDREELRNILEAALLAAARPLDIDALMALFPEGARPERSELRDALTELGDSYDGRGMTLAEVASGFRVQVQDRYAEFVSRLWEERPPRYSRALLETLSIIAYRQPVTRGDIEQVRGVAVATSIIRTLLERGWVRVVGQRDVPGHPEMFGTTKAFLDYFGLKRLDELPALAEIRDIAELNPELDFDGDADGAAAGSSDAPLNEVEADGGEEEADDDLEQGTQHDPSTEQRASEEGGEEDGAEEDQQEAGIEDHQGGAEGPEEEPEQDLDEADEPTVH